MGIYKPIRKDSTMKHSIHVGLHSSFSALSGFLAVL